MLFEKGTEVSRKKTGRKIVIATPEGYEKLEQPSEKIII